MALTSASWTASSADAKSAPRRTRTPITSGISSRSRDSSTPVSMPVPGAAVRSVGDQGRGAEEGPHLQPLVDRLPAGSGRGRQLSGQLDGAVPGVDVDDHPAGDQVLGLRERTIGDRRPPLAVVADEGAPRRERLAVDELAGALE